MSQQQRAGVWLLCLLVVLISHTRIAFAATFLRTATINAEHWRDPQWRTRSGHHRSLLGASKCSDFRWGVLCGRVQVLVQLADGHTTVDRKALLSSLHADGAAISGYLPRDTWLVVARLEDLRSTVYNQHVLLPFSPEYKVAPEWHPVMELVQQEHRQLLGSEQQRIAAAVQHVQLHRRVLKHQAVQRLQLHTPAQDLQAPAEVAHTDAAATAQLIETPAKLLIGVNFPDLPAAELKRLSVDTTNFNPAAAAAADWEAPLSQLVAADGRCQHHLQLCRPELLARSAMELNIAVCPQDLSEVLYWLSNQAAVHWLAPRPRLFLQNAFGSMIVQNNGVSPTADYKSPDSRLFWQAGLDGKGQVIGIGDSGIDMNSCYFKDPAVPFTPPANGSKEWISQNHRKVVYYYGLADNTFRDQVGHGTHTSGTLVGEDLADPTSKAMGAAKGAKVAFVDISMQPTQVNAPQELDTEYFPKMYAQGARIFSDSWGSGNAEYDLQSSRADAWLHSNQDCISHFAAGNYGESDNLDTTITSPAVAKNVVTVGATKSLQPNYLSQTIAPVFLMSVEVKRTGKAPQYISVRLVKADFGGDGSALSGKGLKMVRASPPNACGSLNDAASGKYKDAIVLARRGTCFFSEKMSAGTAAGAAAVLVINDRAGGYFKMDAQDGQLAQSATPISLLAVTQRMGDELWSLFDNADSIAATIERYTDTWEAYEDIAAFSSFGPARDGRIKPDVVCPGELTSASSAQAIAGGNQDTCQMGRKSGTSMATPMVAAHAAIIRQYFMEGFYPSGTAKPSDAYTPSGPLIKAVMMGGACDMKGNTEAYLPLEDSPSMRQGFGRLCLCSSLKLAGKCNTNVQVVDRVVIQDKETHKYCLHSSGGDIRIMLVWYDPPAAVSTGDGASSTLINDLDLAVTSGGMGGQTLLGNHGQTKDSHNTAERVWLRNVPAGGLEISVSAAINVPDGTPQNYSLVVQGAFAGVLASPFNPDQSAKAAAGGGCPAQQMQSAPPVDASTTGNLSTLAGTAAPVNATAVDPTKESAPAAVDMSAARAQEPTAALPATGATPSPAAGDAATASPSPAAAQASPSPSPGADNSALVDMLINTMTTQASPSPSPSGRRLTWVPSPPAALTVRMPVLVCQWLSASGLAPEHNYAHAEDRLMTIPMAAVLAASGLVLLALVALIASQSLHRYRLGRTTSLTSALSADLVKNSSMRTHQQHEQALLVEQLLQRQLSVECEGAPAAFSRTSSRSLNTSNSNSFGSGATSGSSEPSTPTSLPELRSASQCSSSPSRHSSLPAAWPGSLLPSSPVALAVPQQGDAAAMPVPAVAGLAEEANGGSSFSFSHMLDGAAVHSGRAYSKSFSTCERQHHPAVPPWLKLMSAGQALEAQAPRQLQQTNSASLLLQSTWQQQQQQQQQAMLQQERSAPLLSADAASRPPARRASSFTVAIRDKLQQQQPAAPGGLLLSHDDEMPRDQQGFTHS